MANIKITRETIEKEKVVINVTGQIDAQCALELIKILERESNNENNSQVVLITKEGKFIGTSASVYLRSRVPQ